MQKRQEHYKYTQQSLLTAELSLSVNLLHSLKLLSFQEEKAPEK